MAKKIKTRSTFYQRQMSDEVKYQIKTKAEAMGIAGWLLVEILLEKGLGISNKDSIDADKWLGANHSKSRTGKPYRTKRK